CVFRARRLLVLVAGDAAMAGRFPFARMVSSFVSVPCYSPLRCSFRVPHILRAGGLSFLSFCVEPFWHLSPPGPGVGRGPHVGLRNLYIYVAGAGSDGPTSVSPRIYA